MTDHPVVLATFEDVKAIRTRKSVQIICEAPIERYDQILAALGGYPQPGSDVWIGIARVDEKVALIPAQTQTAPVEDAPEPAASTAGWSGAKRKMVQQSGIIRNEEAFHRHVAKNWPSVWNHPAYDGLIDKEKAVKVLHYWCGVVSCRDLDPVGESGEAFRNIMRRYDASQSGQTPSAQETQFAEGPS